MHARVPQTKFQIIYFYVHVHVHVHLMSCTIRVGAYLEIDILMILYYYILFYVIYVIYSNLLYLNLTYDIIFNIFIWKIIPYLNTLQEFEFCIILNKAH